MNKIISLKEQFYLCMENLEKNQYILASKIIKGAIEELSKREEITEEKKEEFYRRIVNHFNNKYYNII